MAAEDFPEKHLKERHEYMSQLTVEIDEIGKRLAESVHNLLPHLKVLRTRGDYSDYIVFGTGIIEYMLEGLIVVYTHAINFNVRRMEEIYTPDYLLDLEVKLRNKATAGTTLGILKETFRFEQKHPLLYRKLEKLISKRNNTVHDLIKQYSGNLAKMNSDLKSYADDEPIEDCFTEILNLQAIINDSLHARKP